MVLFDCTTVYLFLSEYFLTHFCILLFANCTSILSTQPVGFSLYIWIKVEIFEFSFFHISPGFCIFCNGYVFTVGQCLIFLCLTVFFIDFFKFYHDKFNYTILIWLAYFLCKLNGSWNKKFTDRHELIVFIIMYFTYFVLVWCFVFLIQNF